VLVIDNQKLTGILTDRDLRNRIIAEGLDVNTLVSQAMTVNPVTTHANALVFEAMLAMSEHNIHHLPVVDGSHAVGIITSTDILRSQSSQPLLLIGEIGRQGSIENLIQVSKQIPLELKKLVGCSPR
jgi:CBS domain-containing protein